MDRATKKLVMETRIQPQIADTRAAVRVCDRKKTLRQAHEAWVRHLTAAGGHTAEACHASQGQPPGNPSWSSQSECHVRHGSKGCAFREAVGMCAPVSPEL